MSDELDNHDYEHKTSVRDHASLRREKEDPKTGLEPITLSLVAICAAALMIGGGYLGAKSGGFDFASTTQAGYVPGQPDIELAGVELSELDKYLLGGEAVYKAVCNGCHQVTGGGQGQIPPLVESEWVNEGTERFAQIILNGMRGPISVNGASYGAQEMPAQKGALNDAQIAQVMSYVRHKFGGVTDIVVTKEMVVAGRGKHGAQAGLNTVGTLAAADSNLPGEQPEWLNPMTVEGAEVAPAEGDEVAAPQPGT